MRLYLDSAPIIYYIEGTPALREVVSARLAGTRNGQDIAVVSHSHLGRLECRLKPLRENSRSILERYDRFFAAEGVELLDTDAHVWDMATELRARHGLRVPDPLHLACAIVHRCDRFLTNDHRLDRIQEVPVEILAP
jgi:predicted nucleic acid-binding protein